LCSRRGRLVDESTDTEDEDEEEDDDEFEKDFEQYLL
jgi:hypothetical protein